MRGFGVELWPETLPRLIEALLLEAQIQAIQPAMRIDRLLFHRPSMVTVSEPCDVRPICGEW
jgi:hypothetical protein